MSTCGGILGVSKILSADYFRFVRKFLRLATGAIFEFMDCEVFMVNYRGDFQIDVWFMFRRCLEQGVVVSIWLEWSVCYGVRLMVWI